MQCGPVGNLIREEVRWTTEDHHSPGAEDAKEVFEVAFRDLGSDVLQRGMAHEEVGARTLDELEIVLRIQDEVDPVGIRIDFARDLQHRGRYVDANRVVEAPSERLGQPPNAAAEVNGCARSALD